MNINNYKRRKIWKKRIKTTCGVVGFLAFFYLLGVVGGLEMGNSTLPQAITHAVIAITIVCTCIAVNDNL